VSFDIGVWHFMLKPENFDAKMIEPSGITDYTAGDPSLTCLKVLVVMIRTSALPVKCASSFAQA